MPPLFAHGGSRRRGRRGEGCEIRQRPVLSQSATTNAYRDDGRCKLNISASRPEAKNRSMYQLVCRYHQNFDGVRQRSSAILSRSKTVRYSLIEPPATVLAGKKMSGGSEM
mmetsp:Transcript_12303/g.29215  ORF Transcript_12303/g.29215 Transcript_12303/m.29215 type:complete len:111 (-) Transcript_12303:168-500(-)